MSATEELRRLLDERGVVYKKPEDDTTIYYDSNGNRYTYNVNSDSGWSQLFGYNLTPEQAIAATLGEVRAGSSRFELTAEQVREAIFNSSSYASFDGAKYYADGIGMQAIADELNAALGACECECDGTIRWECEWTDQTTCYEHELSCGHVITSMEEEPPNYCEECGARIRKAAGE